MAVTKGPYRSSRPSSSASSRSSLERAPILVTPQRRAQPVIAVPSMEMISPLLPPITTLGSPYQTPQPRQLRLSHPLRRSSLGLRYCVLDDQSHPEVIERILEYADPAALRAFRGTSRKYLQQADALLSHHLLIAATESDTEGELQAEICPVRPGEFEATFVPHGRHPALRHLFTASWPSKRSSTYSDGFLHRDLNTVSDLRIAVRQASAVQSVLASTEVIDIAGRLSLQTMRQLRTMAVNAELYRLHLDESNLHLLSEFDTLAPVTLSIHLSPTTAALPIRSHAFHAVRRITLNIQLSEGKEPFRTPKWLHTDDAPSDRDIEVIIVPESKPYLNADTAISVVGTAFASAITFILNLLQLTMRVQIVCLGLDKPTYAALGITDHELEYLLRHEAAILEHLLLSDVPARHSDHVRRTLAALCFAPRDRYRERIGDSQFALETGTTWFGGNELTHPSDESYNDSSTLVEGDSSIVADIVNSHQKKERVVSLSHSFVVVEDPNGAEHYFPAPSRKLKKSRSRRRRPSGCVIL